MKIFQLAGKILAEHPQLKKVIILKRIYRCDNQIRESLSQFANSVYDDLWRSNGSPDDIVIGDQKLQCEGNLHSLCDMVMVIATTLMACTCVALWPLNIIQEV